MKLLKQRKKVAIAAAIVLILEILIWVVYSAVVRGYSLEEVATVEWIIKFKNGVEITAGILLIVEILLVGKLFWILGKLFWNDSGPDENLQLFSEDPRNRP